MCCRLLVVVCATAWGLLLPGFKLPFRRRFVCWPDAAYLARFHPGDCVCTKILARPAYRIPRSKARQYLDRWNWPRLLCDFGLSASKVDRLSGRSFRGTPKYVAPEVILGRDHGTVVDSWSQNYDMWAHFVSTCSVGSLDVNCTKKYVGQIYVFLKIVEWSKKLTVKLEGHALSEASHRSEKGAKSIS